MTTNASIPPAGGTLDLTGGTPAVPVVPSTPPPVPAPEAPIELDGDAPLPASGKKILISTEALAKRMSRASTGTLKDLGFEDAASAKKFKEDADKLIAQEEERKRAQMTKEQQLEADKAAAENRAILAEQRADALAELQEDVASTQHFQTIAGEYVKPKFAKMILGELADHLDKTYSDEQLAGFTSPQSEEITRKFFEKYAKDNPEIAKGETPPAVPPVVAPKTPQTRPLRNGVGTPAGRGANARPAAKVFDDGPFKGKTLQPNQPNSMTPAEVQQWKKDSGNNY